MTEAEQIMKRCQAGTRNYEEANNLHAACYAIIGKLLAQRKPPTIDARILQAVSDEYNEWILAHASGMSYDDFLIRRLATRSTKENT